MRLLVIDGNSIANRAFFGIKLLTTKDGRYTNAIYGFLNILLSLLKECDPDEVAVAFDLRAPTFRHKMYDGYKATRHGMPEELAQQMPVLKELLADLGYRAVTAEGWEADDILGTLAAACDARKDDCYLATGDRDSLQPGCPECRRPPSPRPSRRGSPGRPEALLAPASAGPALRASRGGWPCSRHTSCGGTWGPAGRTPRPPRRGRTP